MAGYKRMKRPGVWELTVTLGSDYKGKPQRYYKTIKADTERDAEKELSRFFVQCEDGFFNASNITTIAQLCDLYQTEHVARFLKKSTQMSINSTVNNWIKPLLGKKKISKLKKVEVQQWVNHLTDEGKSPKTVRNCYSVLCSMLDYAVSDAELIQRNPAAGCKLPSPDKKESRSYNIEELSKILEGLEDLPREKLPYKCGILLAIFGGFRKAEVLGFNWDDVDFENKSISVVRTRMRAKGIIYEDTPKTDKSRRTVSLPTFIFSELKDLKVSQLEEKLKFGVYYTDTLALLKQPGGEAITPAMFDKFFRAFCPSIGVPCHGLHALRHTHASLLASLGANEVEVSQRLGHANLSTTLNIYTHLFENRDSEIADGLDNFKKKIAK